MRADNEMPSTGRDALPGREIAWAYTVIVHHRPRFVLRWYGRRLRVPYPRWWCDACRQPAPCAYYRKAAVVRDRYDAAALERWCASATDHQAPFAPSPGREYEPQDWLLFVGLALLAPALLGLLGYRLTL